MLKHFPFRNLLPAMVVLAFAMTIAGCSTQKNTAKSRWWHAFNARYNTYYNGTVAYIEGSLEKENGNKDNYSEMIPYYTVGNKNSRELGKSNYDRAIEKCEKAIHQHSIKRRPVWDKKRRKTAKDLEWLQRREYNPFLWKAWMLMGRSQFFEGDFQSAAATFAYMSRLYATQPGIYGKARAWLAKSYLESGWIYDAEDVIRNIERDSIHWRAQKEWDKTYALYYLKTGRYQEAVPYLRKAIGYEMRRKQKARLWYLMGQVEAQQGHAQNAYRAFKHVIRLNPPYELEFNARISMTEVLATNNSRKMVSKLKRMAASDKNQEYLDQVYYAIGNIHLNQGDTLQAIAAYEKGAAKSSRNGVEKGVLLLHLGNVYWQCHRYGDAKRCYDAAIGLLDQDRKDYKQLSDRSKVLDELVPYTDAIHLQDSLQSLARMSKTERNVAIDKVIDALKKQEKEEKRRLADQELAEQQGNSDFGRNNGNNNSRNNRNQGNSNASSGFGNGTMGNGGFGNSNTWYFYSQSAVAQGKQQFERLWGKRKNIDNWQRSNQTVVADAKGVEEMTDEQRDSLLNEAQKKDLEKEKEKNLSAEEDPHQRAYYLAQIPLTEEKMAESNQILDDGLLHAGIILKDKLDNLDESERMLQRLVKKNAAYEHLDDAYYHLYLLYNIRKQPAIASRYLDLLKANYPESQWTALLTSPYYEEDAKMGIHLEDSLYAATYDAFKANLYNKVVHNRAISDKRYPEGANRDKFLFIGGLTQLHEGNIQACLDDMQQVVEKYPNSRLSEMAGMILNGVKAGRQLKGGTFDLSNVWSRRNAVLNDDVKSKAKVFSIERNEPFVFMLAYVPDSVNENQLLFEMAKYNFTSYLVRNFDLVIDEQNGLHRMQVKGFRNYDEARQYANDIYQHQAITQLLSKGARGIVISEPNLLLLGTSLSYDDYTLFYTQHLAPLKISKDPLLEEPEEIIQQEKTDDSEENEEETGTLETGTTGEIETGTTGTFDNGTTGTFSNGTTGTSENGTTGTQGTDADIKEEKAPNTTIDNDDSLDLDSEEYDLDGF